MSEQSMGLVREGGKLLREEHKIRLAVVLIMLLFLVTGRDLMTDSISAYSVYMAVALFVAGLLLSQFSSSRPRQLGAQQFQISAVALSVIDLAAVTLLLRGTGGLGSPFFAFYVVSLIFAAAFFRGLELALLTALAAVLYIGVSWNDLASMGLENIWHLSARLMALILVAWYGYALSSVLHREKDANDQLLRHLTEGVILFNSQERITLVNTTILAMVALDEDEMIGHSRAELTASNNVLSWLLGDVGTAVGGLKTRIGCFPEADLPLVECTTIPCNVDEEAEGWLVVCKDLRDLNADPKSVRRQTCDKLAPLSNLRAMSEALYGMAEYLDDRKRWQAIELIEKHTLALQSLLADMLHGGDEHEQELDLGFVDISSLLANTRRLLEIQPGVRSLAIEIFVQQGLPEVNADRTRLGHCLLQLCRALIAVGKEDDKLVIDVRSGNGTVVFTLELANKTNPDAAPGPLSDEEVAAFGELTSLPIFRVIEEHHGRWECLPDCSHFRRVVFELPFAGPSPTEEEEGDTTEATGTASRGRPGSGTLEPALAAEVTNQLKNTLNVIRGYAEMAMQDEEAEKLREALRRSIELSDQASSLVETLQPSVGEFDLEVKVPEDQPETEAAAPSALAAAPKGKHVLVVDDDASMRGLLVDVLHSAGYETVEANDGRAAVERIRLNRPALAFVDLSMPRVTGVEVMKEARKYAPGLPVVLMTGYATQVAVDALGDEKPYAILSKPFAIGDVLSFARAVVGEAE
ncbi:MAG: response regulator [Armatimonadetes bacterium]|nr:response regulator [Armatimonadota bacterium]